MTVDYRILLKKYMDHVGQEEGVCFVHEADPAAYHRADNTVRLTAEEYAELLAIWHELRVGP